MNESISSIIEMQEIRKTFGRLVAVDDVSLDLKSREIHGLLGENGAGKSTLMKVLYGLYKPDSGVINLEGHPQDIASPHDAINLGIGMVHQHFMQVPTMTVIDNVLLGLRNAREPLLDRNAVRSKIQEISQAYGLSTDPDAYIWQLSVGDRQRVEILKALYRDVHVLILDEPTSVLTPQETDQLFLTLRELITRGLSVLFITHNLDEALGITDRITVMRDGKVVSTISTDSTSKNELARLMVGRDVLFRLEGGEDDDQAGAAVLEVANLHTRSDRDTPAVCGVSFQVRANEIVGIAGVDGNGQTELIQCLTGLRQSEEGVILVNGEDLTNASPEKILNHKVGHIPEEQDDALIGGFSLYENLVLNRHASSPFSKRGIIDQEAMLANAEKLIEAYDVRAQNIHVLARTLSGGNKQKLVLAREFSRNPALLIAAHPTQGVDIGAEEYIRQLLIEQRDAGVAILLISTKLDEIFSLSDRILVMCRGEIRGEMHRGEADVEKIGLLMAGSQV